VTLTPDCLRVLHLEDGPADVRFVRAALGTSSITRFEVTDAATLTEGLGLLEEQRFDVVVTDLTLPDAVGIEAWRRLQQAAPAVPVLVLSGTGSEQHGARVVAEGAQAFLDKDEVGRRLLPQALLQAVLRQARLTAEVRRREELERELTSLARLAEAPARVSAGLYGVGSLTSGDLRPVVDRYGALLDAAVEGRFFKLQEAPPYTLRELATQLAWLGAGPRDVIEVHRTALEPRRSPQNSERTAAYHEEGRLLVLELMGHLAAQYRHLAGRPTHNEEASS